MSSSLSWQGRLLPPVIVVPSAIAMLSGKRVASLSRWNSEGWARAGRGASGSTGGIVGGGAGANPDSVRLNSLSVVFCVAPPFCSMLSSSSAQGSASG
eukprot:6701854-Pyramimonas_sp.AAC.1